MKKYILFSLLLFLGACMQGNNQNVSKKINKLETKTIQQEQKITLTKWDKSILLLALKRKNIDICKKVKHITVEECEQLYKSELEKLNKLDCVNMKYLKNECDEKLAIKNKDCEKIQDRAEKIKCQYEKDLKKALKENNQEFCKKLPFQIKKDCEQKFKNILTK